MTHPTDRSSQPRPSNPMRSPRTRVHGKLSLERFWRAIDGVAEPEEGNEDGDQPSAPSKR